MCAFGRSFLPILTPHEGGGVGGEGLGIGKGNQRLKCKKQNCGGPSGGILTTDFHGLNG